MGEFARRCGGLRMAGLLVAAGAVGTAGCTREVDDARPVAAVRAAPVVLAGSSSLSTDPGMRGRPGANPDETKKYLESLEWADTIPFAAAEFDVNTRQGTARVKVVPMMVAHEVSWHKAVGAGMPAGNGHFVARIYNLEGKQITPLGMMEKDTGYLWVGERGISGRGAAVYVMTGSGQVARRKNLAIVGFCAGQHPGPKVRSTEAKDCPGGLGAVEMLSLASRRSSQSLVDQGIWVTCTGGCCEVSMLL